MTATPMRVAIVGAGIAGLACARRLQQFECAVTLYGKSKGPGGRCATRRSDVGAFDHGAPQFSARTDAFLTELSSWQQEGWVVPAGEEGPWLGVPSMSALTRRLAAPLTLVASTQIVAVERRADGWMLQASAPDGALQLLRYDAVIIATPAEQAVPLLASSPSLQTRLESVHSDPCWTLMAAWSVPLRLPATRLTPADGPLAAAWRDDTKPQRPAVDGVAERWVLHGRAAWTRAHLDIDAGEAAEELLAALGRSVGTTLPVPIHRVAHRWRYAQVQQPAGEAFGWDAQAGIGSCGDAWRGSRAMLHLDGVERAWLSGTALADTMRVVDSARNR